MNNETAIEVASSNKPVKMGPVKKRGKQLEVLQINKNVQATSSLSDEAVLALLISGLDKEEQNRNEDELAVISAQSQFTINAVLTVQEVNRKLDEQHNQKIDEIEAYQRKAADTINAMLSRAIAGQQAWAKKLNEPSPEFTKALAEFLGSEDPKE